MPRGGAQQHVPWSQKPLTLLITTSWDDGHPADQRVAECLARHGLAGTFFVPTRNAEGRPVLTMSEIRSLATVFEIGGHGRDHVPLTGLSSDELAIQIRENKSWLQDGLGRQVDGFCYVRGRFDGRVKVAAAAAGYRFARTTRNMSCAAGPDPMALPTTVQFYPHGPSIYLRNFARRPRVDRVPLLASLLGAGSLAGRMGAALNRCGDGVFHLWGHSWEIDQLGLWTELDAFFAELRRQGDRAEFLTNGQLVARVMPRNNAR